MAVETAKTDVQDEYELERKLSDILVNLGVVAFVATPGEMTYVLPDDQIIDEFKKTGKGPLRETRRLLEESQGEKFRLKIINDRDLEGYRQKNLDKGLATRVVDLDDKESHSFSYQLPDEASTMLKEYAYISGSQGTEVSLQHLIERATETEGVTGISIAVAEQNESGEVLFVGIHSHDGNIKKDKRITGSILMFELSAGAPDWGFAYNFKDIRGDDEESSEERRAKFIEAITSEPYHYYFGRGPVQYEFTEDDLDFVRVGIIR